jgi:hypothetical protein
MVFGTLTGFSFLSLLERLKEIVYELFEWVVGLRFYFMGLMFMG